MRVRATAFAAAILAALCTVSGLGAQSFGFGEVVDDASAPNPGVTGGVRVGGGVDFVVSAFLGDLEDPAGAALREGSVGRLNFEASGTKAEAAFKLKVSEAILAEDPAKLIDEAYVRLFLGPAVVEGGLLKVVWGKADSQGVLDVLNPLDLSDLSITDNLERKISQPMLRASLAISESSKFDAAFIPSLTGNEVAWEGPWMPAELGEYKDLFGIDTLEDAEGVIAFPDTSRLKYAQVGVRFTTTVGSVDLGAQYFYGFLPNFAVSPSDVGRYLTMKGGGGDPAPIPVSFNRYHQAGLDAAVEFIGLNWRAEAAMNLTDDRSGDDPDVYNPFFAWNLGFDRELWEGISLNLQGSGSVRLFDGKVSNNGAMDLEHGTDATATKITAHLSQKLFMDTVEWKLAGIWGVEGGDFLFYPSLGYILGDARLDLAVGIFGGEKNGELGQFSDSSYAKLTLGYRF